MPFDGQVTETNTDKLILQRARDRVARGWCQGRLQDARGRVCILGALDGVLNCVEDGARFGRIANALYAGLPTGVSLSAWNDHPHRTQAEVLARFDEAIAKLETNNG